MVHRELFDYIHQQTQQGISKQAIIEALLGRGWQQRDIAAAFSFFENGDIFAFMTPEKRGMVWIVSQIFFRGGLVMLLANVILAFAAGIAGGVILVFMGANPEDVEQIVQHSQESGGVWFFVTLGVTSVSCLLSYIGILWGCRYVSKKTSIEERDYGKIGYWAGMIPVVSSLLFGPLVLAFLFFVTPFFVKRWFTKYQGMFQGLNV